MDTKRVWLVVASLAVAAGLFASDALAEKTPLLAVSKGQLPNDTGMDVKTKMFVEPKGELGGACMKVELFPRDSFGHKPPGVRNWKAFESLEFDVFNPAAEPVKLSFTVKHKRSRSYQTRIEAPFVVAPGKSTVTFYIDELSNTNGSAPDLSEVTHWYISDAGGKGATLYFGDFYLVGDPPAPAKAVGAALGGGPFHITGKIKKISEHEYEVDLLAAPAAAAAPPARPVTDPARLARIRAAKMPPVRKPILFNTPEADAVCAALEVFPPDNPWNEVIEDSPVHPNSDAMIASVGEDLKFRFNRDMGFVIVPPDQKRVPVKLLKGGYGESDPGPYPVPANAPIEGWPMHAKGTLDQLQRVGEGDRHCLVLDPMKRVLYEFYIMRKTDAGWQAVQASVFDLSSNDLRPPSWTSADAAGLPIFPAVVRYDDVARGIVQHAMRVTIRKTRKQYIYPATHYASRLTETNLPRMGERIRLKKNFDITPFGPHTQAILKGLKKYGMFVADNGIEWAISVAPDERIKITADEFSTIKGNAFEVVVATPMFAGGRKVGIRYPK